MRGQTIARYFQALGAGRGDTLEATAYARDRWPANIVGDFLRAASTAGSTVPGKWGVQLAPFEAASAEFFGLVQEQSIPGRMNLRRAPFQVQLISEIMPPVANWVAEGKAKPISEISYSADVLGPVKVSAIVVASLELLRTSSPASETWLRDSLVSALVKRINASFVSGAGVAGESPASIVVGAPTVASTGDWSADLAAALALFTGSIEDAWLLMSGRAAAKLSGAAMPNLSVRGGEASGFPVVTDKALGTNVILADASRIVFAEGPVIAGVSTAGSLEMNTTPTGTATYSLWQRNAVALREELPCNWRVAGPAGSVVTITGVAV